MAVWGKDRPGRCWRDEFRDSFRYRMSEDASDEQYRTAIREALAEERRDSPDAGGLSGGARGGRLILAVCAFASGDLSAADEVFACADPPELPKLHFASGCLSSLLPHPPGLDSRRKDDRDRILAWFDRNREHLIWAEDEQRFVHAAEAL